MVHLNCCKFGLLNRVLVKSKRWIGLYLSVSVIILTDCSSLFKNILCCCQGWEECISTAFCCTSTVFLLYPSATGAAGGSRLSRTRTVSKHQNRRVNNCLWCICPNFLLQMLRTSLSGLTWPFFGVTELLIKHWK